MIDAERERLRQLERVLLNLLGTTDPQKVATWICFAAFRGEIPLGDAEDADVPPEKQEDRALPRESVADSTGSC